MEKILLVDDETDFEFLIQQKFRKQIQTGIWDLVFSHNGQDALELVQNDSHIAVVVLDLNMPGMDGMTLLDKLKEYDPAIKTIVVSAYSDIKTFRTAMNKGAFDFITKPVDFKDLGYVIEQAISLYRSFLTPLAAYQISLESLFPQQVQLTYSRQEKFLLWDAIQLDTDSIIIMGLVRPFTACGSKLNSGTIHGILLTILRKEGFLSLKQIEDEISKINPSLMTEILMARYTISTHEFFYEKSGEFTVGRVYTSDDLSVPPSTSILLTPGDAFSITHPLSPSILSFNLKD